MALYIYKKVYELIYTFILLLSTQLITFQIALVTDSHTNVTYALLLYDDTNGKNDTYTKDVLVGFHNG